MSSVSYIQTCHLPTRWGNFRLHGFADTSNNHEYIALSMGDLTGEQAVLTRVHSECLTGDSLFSLRCDCGEQLALALEKIAQAKRGLLIYLPQEGRGIGLLNKIKAYHLQDQGHDTVEANELLGFAADLRDYSACPPILARLGVKRLALMTNNPQKIAALTQAGIEIVERIALKVSGNPHNKHYLATKAEKLGHLF